MSKPSKFSSVLCLFQFPWLKNERNLSSRSGDMTILLLHFLNFGPRGAPPMAFLIAVKKSISIDFVWIKSYIFKSFAMTAKCYEVFCGAEI